MPAFDKIEYTRVLTEEQKEIILNILNSYKLVVEDVDDNKIIFALGWVEGIIVTVAGLERYDEVGFLRSVAVSMDRKGFGYGRELCLDVLQKASQWGISRLFLLTQTAAPFFAKLGFIQSDRSFCPEVIRKTKEFSHLCPSSSTLMEKILK